MKREFAILLLIPLFALLLAACNTAATTPTPAPTPTPTARFAGLTLTPNATTAATGSTLGDAAGGIAGAGQAIASRTPIPTPTLSPVQQKIDQVANASGIAGDSFLGLSVTDWINIAISLLIVLAGYILGGRLLMHFLRWLVGRIGMTLDDNLLGVIGKDLKWLVVILFARFAVMRLDFIAGGLRTLLDDIFFVLLLGMGTVLALRLVNYAAYSYLQGLPDATGEARLDAVMTAAHRLANYFIVIIALAIGLDHFGIDVSPISATLLVIGILIVLAAKDVISDVISGFIILGDQPFRAGDVIQLQELDTTGTVESIKTRATHIRTSADREVIIPNSKIIDGQIVNYSHPYPRFRIDIDIGVAYGSDTAQVQQVLTKAVRSVKGVKPNKAVDVYFHEWGDSAKTMRVRWWIDSYGDKNQVLDKVNTAIEKALASAGIDSPFATYAVNLMREEQRSDSLPQTSSDAPTNMKAGKKTSITREDNRDEST
jgi:small-conductance mechanosensitive channel